MNLNFNHEAMFYKNHFLFIGVLMICVSALQAQPSERIEPHSERIEAVRTRFFTRQMQLTPKEARLFWPLYDEFLAKQEKLKGQREEWTPESAEAFNIMTDEEINAMIDARLQQAETALDDRRKFISDLREVLPPRKVAMFLRAEHRFTMELRQRVQERRTRQPNQD